MLTSSKSPKESKKFIKTFANNWSMALMFHFLRPFGCEFSTTIAFVYLHLCEVATFNNIMMK
jgi:hypothetical protein